MVKVLLFAFTISEINQSVDTSVAAGRHKARHEGREEKRGERKKRAAQLSACDSLGRSAASRSPLSKHANNNIKHMRLALRRFMVIIIMKILQDGSI